jgi:protease I
VTDDAGESHEILYAKHRFQEAGWETVIAASRKKTINAVIHDFAPGWNTYIEKPGYLIEADADFSQVTADDFDAMLIVGGRAPEFLRHDERLIQLVQKMHRDGKWIFAICHGIQVLLAAGIGPGKELTCYENVRFELESCGGKWIDRQSVVSGNLITAQTWESHPEFYRDIFAHLK